MSSRPTLPFNDPAPERPAPVETRVCDGCHVPAMHLTLRGSEYLCAGCNAAKPINPHEIKARTKKAFDIAEKLISYHFTSVELGDADSHFWSLAATAAGHHNTPSLECRLMVIDALKAREAGVKS